MRIQAAQKRVFDDLISLIEKVGKLPWQLPWLKKAGYQGHYNTISGHEYQGINSMMTALSASAYGFASDGWLTQKQADSIGAVIADGAKPCRVIFCSKLKKAIDLDNGDQKIKSFWLWKDYLVYNTDQITNYADIASKLKNKALDAQPSKPLAGQEAPSILDCFDFDVIPEVRNINQNQAYYSPITDYINIPEFENFLSPDRYYSTLFHELVHSTGHKSRLNRFKPDAQLAAFGSEEYSKEELVAEIGAAYLCSFFGVNTDFSDQQSAVYLKNWLTHIKDKPHELFSAAGKAQQAYDYLLGNTKTASKSDKASE